MEKEIIEKLNEVDLAIRARVEQVATKEAAVAKQQNATLLSNLREARETVQHVITILLR